MLNLLVPPLIWLSILLLSWALFQAVHQGIAYVKRLHQIPCDRCVFFTGNPCLKCTVQPYLAMTEAAIQCADYLHLSSHPSHSVLKEQRSILKEQQDD